MVNTVFLDLGSLDAAIDRIRDDAKQQVEGTVKQIYFVFHETLVKETPRKTGRLHSNWNIGQGAPDFDSDNLDVSKAHSIARGKAEINAWKITDAPLVISNSVPYAGFINDGTERIDAHDMTGKARRAVQRFFNFTP